jgi:para-aminobenzoate synthetase/4-amino-4-deoxychorismate lyase
LTPTHEVPTPYVSVHEPSSRLAEGDGERLTPRSLTDTHGSSHRETESSVKLFRTVLPTKLTLQQVARCFRNDPRPFALTGRWAEGGALVGSERVRVADDYDDPFQVITELPLVEGVVEGAVGGGWFGYFGYQLGGTIESLPRPPRRPVPLPYYSLAYYDHLLRYDERSGEWWFEALWSPGRAVVLQRRLELSRARLAGAAEPAEPYRCDSFVATPDPQTHLGAVRRCRDYIMAGDIFQANLCIRLEAGFTGDPLDLFCKGLERLEPPYTGFIGGPWGAVASLSPELFLRRNGRKVRTAPIKGTCPRSPSAALEQRRRLLASAKDRAENVMIVDLMRNDLGRVCEFGSIRVPSLVQAEAHPGVWHLVSEVTGELREGDDDAALLRATFPPGSITGAPKIRAMEVISELESSAREAYTGSVGFVSPLAGLELSVAIRTFEFGDGRAWLGVGGGIVADSDPEAEFRECLTKAMPLVRAVGASLDGDLNDWSAGKSASRS